MPFPPAPRGSKTPFDYLFLYFSISSFLFVALAEGLPPSGWFLCDIFPKAAAFGCPGAFPLQQELW